VRKSNVLSEPLGENHSLLLCVFQIWLKSVVIIHYTPPSHLWLSSGTPVSSTNKTDRYDITKILLKVPLNTINNKTKPIKTDIQNSTIILVEDTRIPGENHWPVATRVTDKLSHNAVLSTPRLSRIRTHNVSDDRHWLHR
jgi:hypothetical protein